MLDDITIERPCWKDYKHVLKCIIEDRGLTQQDFDDPGMQYRRYTIAQEAFWFFANVDKDDVYLFFKNNEYAGFAAIEPKMGIIPAIATELEVRIKFRNSMVFLAAVDCALNLLYPKLDVIIERTSIKELNDMTVDLNIGPMHVKVFTPKSKYKVNNIVKRFLRKKNKHE